MADDFPDDVRRFLKANISSVAQLEMLLLLQGESSPTWRIAEISRILCLTPEMCSLQLADLQSRGLVATQGEGEQRVYRYEPQNDEVAAVVPKLQQVYAQRRVSVITAIYSEPIDRVRTFADAFKLRKEK